MIILYCLEECPRCQEIKNKLITAGYEFQEVDMSTAESITELRINGCFAIEAPVLRVDNAFYEYCHCQSEGFFTELFGLHGDQKEIPQINGRMHKEGEFLERYVR